MAKLRYNLDEIASFSVEPGKYRAKLVKVEQGLSKVKKPMLTWYWKIISGSEKGKEMRSWTSLQENALSGLKEHLEAFNLHGKINTDTDRLVGKVVVLVVGIRVSNDASGTEVERASVVKLLPDKSSDEDDEEEETEEEEVEDEEDSEDEEDDDEEDEEEDDEEEEETPRRRPTASSSRRPAAKSAPAKKASKPTRKGGLPF